jgi:hypothetical protein
LVALVAPSVAAQGETGYYRGEGNLDIVLSLTLDSYDEFWVADDKVEMAGVGEVERTTATLYAAYGLCDDIDLTANAAWVDSTSDGDGGAPDESDLQDLVLAAKWRAWQHESSAGRYSISLSPGIKLPLTDYEENAITAIGDGQVDLRGRAILHGEWAGGWFASLETGYDRRNGAPDDEFPLHLRGGKTFAGTLTVGPFFSRVDSLGGNDISTPGSSFPENEEDFTRAGISAYARLGEQVGAHAGWHTTLDGRNTGDVEGFTVGLVYRM